jgi:hypothetical protein
VPLSFRLDCMTTGPSGCFEIMKYPEVQKIIGEETEKRITAEELAKLRTLQKLVNNYMAADPISEACQEHYDNLEVWWKDQQIKQGNP